MSLGSFIDCFQGKELHKKVETQYKVDWTPPYVASHLILTLLNVSHLSLGFSSFCKALRVSCSFESQTKRPLKLGSGV